MDANTVTLRATPLAKRLDNEINDIRISYKSLTECSRVLGERGATIRNMDANTVTSRVTPARIMNA